VGCARAGREDCFIEHPEVYVKKALETGVFLRMGLVGRPGGDAFFAGEFERKVRF